MRTTIDQLLGELHRSHGDTASIEVKSAAGGLPQTLTSSICALANLPGGGVIILGLDERRGFTPSGLTNPQALAQGIAGKAQSCAPPARVSIEHVTVAGQPVIVAEVSECAPSAKPCRVRPGGPAYVRLGDGDFEMSPLEEQAFLAQREQPHFDRLPVDGAKLNDLDPRLVDIWSRTVTERDARGLGQFEGRELLFRAGIVTADDVPTKAGLLALGVHPQQFMPRMIIDMAVERSRDSGHIRAKDVVTATGPIPVMLESALAWAGKVFDDRVTTTPGGSLRDTREYPLDAFRELIGNAMVHRDLDSWSEGRAIEVRLRNASLVVTSPGGLYGISVDRLGQKGVTSARNNRLVEICKYVRSTDGARVAETPASGIPRILDTLRADGLPQPEFSDSGLAFTAILRQRPSEDVSPPGSVRFTVAHVPMRGSQQSVWEALGDGRLDMNQLVRLTGIRRATVSYALRRLAEKGRTETIGGPGRATTYRRLPD